MTNLEADALVFVVPVGRVKESIQALLARLTHQYFPAYLYLRQLAGREGRTTGLAPQWSELGEVLDVPGGPPTKPYLRPFWPTARTANQEWLASNLAGSYSPSSIRPGQPASRIVETDAAGQFNLRPQHWELALEHLLLGTPLPAVALAAFVFRNRGFTAAELPQADDLVSAFRTEYGYGPSDDAEFDRVYDVTWRGQDGPWFEPFDERPEPNE